MNLFKVLAVVACILFSTHVFAAEFFLKVTGTVQGPFKGENPAGQIPLLGYDFQVQTPIDAASGLPVGRRRYQPIEVTKNLDLASAQLLKALINNENLPTVTIQAFTATKDGKVSAAYTITLTNASVVGFTQGANAKDIQTEHVTFSFEKIAVKIADLTATDTFVPGN